MISRKRGKGFVSCAVGSHTTGKESDLLPFGSVGGVLEADSRLSEPVTDHVGQVVHLVLPASTSYLLVRREIRKFFLSSFTKATKALFIA